MVLNSLDNFLDYDEDGGSEGKVKVSEAIRSTVAEWSMALLERENKR